MNWCTKEKWRVEWSSCSSLWKRTQISHICPCRSKYDMRTSFVQFSFRPLLSSSASSSILSFPFSFFFPAFTPFFPFQFCRFFPCLVKRYDLFLLLFFFESQPWHCRRSGWKKKLCDTSSIASVVYQVKCDNFKPVSLKPFFFLTSVSFSLCLLPTETPKSFSFEREFLGFNCS